jgi:PAS domain S-box-containing protein
MNELEHEIPEPLRSTWGETTLGTEREYSRELEHLRGEVKTLKRQLAIAEQPFEGLDDLTLRLDLNNVILHINSAAAKFFGINKPELEAQPFSVLSKGHHPDVVREIVRELKTLESQQNLSFQTQTVDGRMYSVSLQKINQGVALHIRDVSEENKLKKYVRQYVSADLEDLSAEELSTFTYPERRFMSVSFTDMRGFTSMSEGLSPEEVRNIINTYLDEVIQAVEDQGNTVDKIVGDEVMALYGAPRYHKNHALRAIQTSWEQIQNLAEAQRLFRSQGKDIPDCGVGVNTGDMVLGNIGGGSRSDYTVLGASVNLGARLCSQAAPAQVLCSRMTLDSVLENLPASWEFLELEEEVEEPIKGGEIFRQRTQVIRVGPKVKSDPRKAQYRFVALPEVHVKGIDRPIPIYSVLGQKRRHAHRLSEEVVHKEKVLRIFGEYHLTQELGRGGMGQVFLAKDSFANEVAIKMLLAGEGSSESQIARFAREAKIMAKLNHRNLCRIHKVGEVDGTRFIAMEFVDGGSLADLIGPQGFDLATPFGSLATLSESTIAKINQRQIRLKDGKSESRINGILRFFLEILEGLHYAHQHGILHRDIAPANVMLRSTGEAVLMDFGLAKFEVAEENEVQVSMTGQMMGTIDYVAPEQAAGAGDVDFRADLYSSAAVLYRMLTGAKHFESSGNILNDINTLAHHRPAPPSLHQKDIEDDLDTVLLKALESDPNKRYPDIEAFAADLRAVIEGLPIMARRLGPMELARRWVRRHKALSATLAISGILLLSTLITYVVHMRSALERFQVAEARANAERQKAEGTLLDLKDELQKSLKLGKWEASKHLAYKILLYEKDHSPALDVIEKADFEQLKLDFPFREHPPSGVPKRISYFKEGLEAWRKLEETGNVYAGELREAFQNQLIAEKEEMQRLEKSFDELGIQKDLHGYYFEHSTGLRFRYIPPGEFTMGDLTAKPVHRVIITNGFFLSETEVTQEVWMKVFDVNPSVNNRGGNHPVEGINWSEALMFCDMLNEEYGYQTLGGEDPSRIHLTLLINRRGFRLPSEAEWEYAARADLPNQYNFWWESVLDEEVDAAPPLWYAGTTGHTHDNRQSRPVGQHLPNPWGLRDMNGNLFEWVLDTYDEDFYKNCKLKNPICKDMTGPGVVRGGNFRNSFFNCRNGGRQAIDHTIRHETFGFRIYFKL